MIRVYMAPPRGASIFLLDRIVEMASTDYGLKHRYRTGRMAIVGCMAWRNKACGSLSLTMRR